MSNWEFEVVLGELTAMQFSTQGLAEWPRWVAAVTDRLQVLRAAALERRTTVQ